MCTARRRGEAVGRGDGSFGEEAAVPKMLFDAGGESFGKLFEGLRREFFGLQFNEQFVIFFFSSTRIIPRTWRASGSQTFTGIVVALGHRAGDVANAGDVGGAFGHGDGAVGVKQIEGVAGLSTIS